MILAGQSKSNYAAWAEDKEFYVGDELVNGTTFNDCAIPVANEALATGNNVIPLATPGRKCYICGEAAQCKGGQKLAITVWHAMNAPAPAPAPAPNGTATSRF